MPKPSEDSIGTRARQLWEAAGKTGGRDWEFWIEAERQLTEDVAHNRDEKSDIFLEWAVKRRTFRGTGTGGEYQQHCEWFAHFDVDDNTGAPRHSTNEGLAGV